MSRVEIRVSSNWDRWQTGLRHLDRELGIAVEQVWDATTDVFFDRSQEYAHVLSGDMKDAGRATISHEGRGTIVGTVEYADRGDKKGGVHAVMEEKRGGEHAFLTRAWEATEAMFSRAIPEAWAEVTRSWR